MNYNINKLYNEIGNITCELKRGNYHVDEFTTDESLIRIIQFSNRCGIKLDIIISEIEVVTKYLAQVDEDLDKALAAPKLTMKILHFLPFIAILISILLGSKPWITYLQPVGLILLTIGGFFWMLGKKIIDNKIAIFERNRVNSLLDCPLIMLCIFKSAVLSGLSIGVVLEEFYIEGTAKLSNGVPFRLAGFDDYLLCLEDVYYKGGSPTSQIDAKISQIYREMLHNLKVKGEELAVMLTVPLAACFLPSFIFIGVIPTIISLAT